MIFADEGGSILLSDGAELVIPPGVLSQDTEVTLTRVTCGRTLKAAEFASCAYEVRGRPELDLQGRYELKLPSRDPSVQPACVFSMTSEGWRCQANALTGIGHAVTMPTRFGAFALHADNPSLSPMNLMTDLDFDICGGNLFGMWELAFFAGPAEAFMEVVFYPPNPAFQVCEPYSHYAGNIVHGVKTLTITPTTGDGPEVARYEEYHYHEGYELNITTEECLAKAGFECSIQSPHCTSEGGICTCRLPFGTLWGGDVFLYEVEDGYSLSEGGPPLEYCVLEDTLIHCRIHEGFPACWVYQRK